MNLPAIKMSMRASKGALDLLEDHLSETRYKLERRGATLVLKIPLTLEHYLENGWWVLLIDHVNIEERETGLELEFHLRFSVILSFVASVGILAGVSIGDLGPKDNLGTVLLGFGPCTFIGLLVLLLVVISTVKRDLRIALDAGSTQRSKNA